MTWAYQSFILRLPSIPFATPSLFQYATLSSLKTSPALRGYYHRYHCIRNGHASVLRDAVQQAYAIS